MAARKSRHSARATTAPASHDVDRGPPQPGVPAGACTDVRMKA
jgi:hypothetical protein